MRSKPTIFSLPSKPCPSPTARACTVPAHGCVAFEGEDLEYPRGFVYGRVGNPTRLLFEETMAGLEVHLRSAETGLCACACSCLAPALLLPCSYLALAAVSCSRALVHPMSLLVVDVLVAGRAGLGPPPSLQAWPPRAPSSWRRHRVQGSTHKLHSADGRWPEKQGD